jgi:hypothetical protein
MIPKRLSSHCAANVQRLRSDCTAIAQRLYSYYAAILMPSGSDCIVIKDNCAWIAQQRICNYGAFVVLLWCYCEAILRQSCSVGNSIVATARQLHSDSEAVA